MAERKEELVEIEEYSSSDRSIDEDEDASQTSTMDYIVDSPYYEYSRSIFDSIKVDYGSCTDSDDSNILSSDSDDDMSQVLTASSSLKNSKRSKKSKHPKESKKFKGDKPSYQLSDPSESPKSEALPISYFHDNKNVQDNMVEACEPFVVHDGIEAPVQVEEDAVMYVIDHNYFHEGNFDPFGPFNMFTLTTATQELSGILLDDLPWEIMVIPEDVLNIIKEGIAEIYAAYDNILNQNLLAKKHTYRRG